MTTGQVYDIKIIDMSDIEVSDLVLWSADKRPKSSLGVYSAQQ